MIRNKKINSLIYFDNNATTFMPEEVKKVMISAMDQGNPSASYSIAEKSKTILQKTKEYLAQTCHCSLDDYHIVLTSGASESNNYMLRVTAEAYKHVMGERPHIIISAIEHKTSILCCEYMERVGMAEVSYVKPSPMGEITAADVEAHVKPNTCLISVIHANNETGIINDIQSIGAMAHRKRIPFHSDIVQSFGKFGFNPAKMNTDAFSISFHKLHGPTGIGALVIKKALVRGYNMCALICGTQNDGLRGGTESAFLAAGALAGMRYTFNGRDEKNASMTKLKKLLLYNLKDQYNLITWNPNSTFKRGFNIVIFGNINKTLPNTVLMSMVYLDKEGAMHAFCNVAIRDLFNQRDIIVALGSACNKGAANHVLQAMNIPDFLRKSVIRVSFGDSNTEAEVEKFARAFKDVSRQLLHELGVE